MVDVAAKPESPRYAHARARVQMAAATYERIVSGSRGGEGLAKGDVLTVARLAAIAGAKLTPQVIPLCHPVRVTHVDVDMGLDAGLPGVVVEVRVGAHDRTGPEMEALTAATVAALTVIDMCKAIDRTLAIVEVVLLAKGGGKSGHWRRDPPP
jgi:cyclic pyranopterin phosphate synthase